MNSGVLLLMYWMIVYESLNVKASLSWFLSKMMTIWCSSSYKYKYCILLAADISQCFKYLNVEKVQFGEAKLILNFYTTATLFQTPPLHLKKSLTNYVWWWWEGIISCCTWIIWENWINFFLIFRAPCILLSPLFGGQAWIGYLHDDDIEMYQVCPK